MLRLKCKGIHSIEGIETAQHPHKPSRPWPTMHVRVEDSARIKREGELVRVYLRPEKAKIVCEQATFVPGSED